MANQVLNVNVQVSPGGTLTNTYDYAVAVDNIGRFPINASALTNGSGVQQGNTWAVLSSTIAAGGNWDIDLTNMTNLFSTVNLSTVKVILFSLDSPNGLKYINLSPSPTNPFGGIPTGSAIVNNNYYAENIFSGWGVNGTHKNIRLNNPTASSILVHGWICGVQ